LPLIDAISRHCHAADYAMPQHAREVRCFTLHADERHTMLMPCAPLCRDTLSDFRCRRLLPPDLRRHAAALLFAMLPTCRRCRLPDTPLTRRCCYFAA